MKTAMEEPTLENMKAYADALRESKELIGTELNPAQKDYIKQVDEMVVAQKKAQAEQEKQTQAIQKSKEELET